MKKSKVVVWGGFTNSRGKKRSEKQGRREKYTLLNVQFQRKVRRHKKTFFNEQCKEVEENNRMGKTRDLFKKTEDIKGTFQEKIKTRTIKDNNSKDLTGAEVIKKRLQEYTEELYKKDLHNPDGVITHLEPDILECDP